MKKLFIILFAVVAAMNFAFSQGITTGTPSNPSVALDVNSANQGLLVPRMTQTQKLAISSPATGLLIYQTNGVAGFWYYNGTAWVQAPTGASGANGVTGTTGPIGPTGSTNGWVLTGNAGTNGGTNFLGTTDNASLRFRTNNAAQLIIDSLGKVGIGTMAPSPSAKLYLSSSSQGFLLPRMTETQRNAIISPTTGLQVFNLTTNCLNIWLGSNWKQFCGDCSFSNPVAGSNSPICTGATLNLTATTIAGATYQWTGPNSFTSTLQNPSITNTTAAAIGTYSVTATLSGCTSSPQSTYVASLAAPVISNNGPLCAGQTLVLITYAVPNVTYSWTGPNSFTSTTQNITLTNATAANSGTYQLVETVNGCTSSTGSNIATVYATVPAQPGIISGPIANLGSQTGVVYSISPVTNAISYTWTVPTGASITAGQGGTSITVSFTCSGSGNIGVTATNTCGTGAQQTLAVSTSVAAPGAITGSIVMCPNSVQTYSISPVAYATSYTWSAPTGASILSGQGSTSISVNVGSVGSGNISVTQTSLCGTSTPATLAITNVVSTFTYSPSAGIIGSTPVTFYPTSTFTGCTYSWTFQGGTPSSSTVQNPVVTWPTQSSPTPFNVTLSVYGCLLTTTNPVLIIRTITYNASGTGASGSIQTFTVPSATTTLFIEAWGAQGSNSNGGLGARMKGQFTASPGDVIQIAVGQQAITSTTGGGGGGGSFIYNSTSSTLLLVAGGGGGGGASGSGVNANITTSGTSDQNGANTGGTGGSGGGTGGTWGGAGGGGFSTNGADGKDNNTGGRSWANGLTGGTAGSTFGGPGGYGGGGGATWGSGGGGGYSGGAGANSAGLNGTNYGGGGGGSYNAGTNQSSTAGAQTGNGRVIINY